MTTFEVPPAKDTDPLTLAVRLASSGLFDDYVAYESDNRWVVAGGVAAAVSLSADRVTTMGHMPGSRRWTGSPGAALATALAAAAPTAEWNAYGWVGFEFSTALAHLRNGSVVPTGELARMILPCTEIVIDADRTIIRSLDPQDAERARNILTSAHQPVTHVPADIDVRVGGGEYRNRVHQMVQEIQQDRYQKAILSRRLHIPFEVDIEATYETGRRANTPARSFLLHLDGMRAAGFSPEVILTVDTDRRVVTQPLAGTRAFARGNELDTAARHTLESDPKEIYEHAISVQLAQDELRSICRPGSVSIEDFMTVKERGSVQHLGSLLTGSLQHPLTAWDALEALFPAVTASGIPKPAALQAIRTLEEASRELYSGAVLHVGHDGTMDAALVLRTVFQKDNRTWLHAGAGIVANSTPEREFEETCEKLSSVAPYLIPRSASTHTDRRNSPNS